MLHRPLTTLVLLAPVFLLGAFAACGDDDAAPPVVTGAGGAGGTGSTGIGGEFQAGATTTGAGGGNGGEGGEAEASYVWDQTHGGDASIFVANADVDTMGNIVVAGSFSGGSAVFGSTTLPNAGLADAFVTKLDSDGQALWAVGAGNGDIQGVAGVATDNNGNVWVTGGFKGSLDFGGNNLVASGNLFDDVYIAKLDPSGGHLFSNRFGGSIETDVSNAVATGPSGEVVITGSFQNSIDFGGSALMDAGNVDLFVARFDASGGHTFSARFGGAGARQEGFATAVATTGGFAVGGSSLGDIDFGDGTVTNTGGIERGIVIAFNQAGTVTFGKMFGGAGTSVVSAVAYGPGGDLWVAGSFKGSIDLGAGAVDAVGNNDDLFVARFDATGNLVFGRRYGSEALEQAASLVVDSDGFATVAGRFKGTWVVNGLNTLDSTAEVNDAFLLRIGPPGNGYWAVQAQADQDARGRGVALTPGGDVVFVGEYQGSIDLGSGTATAPTTSKNLFVGAFSTP